MPAVKPPGTSAYPTNDFSLTVTKTKDDVGLDALDSVALFIEQHCLKGGVSTEVGQRAFQLHLQGVFRIHWPSTKEYVQRLQKIVKSILPANGKLYKVLVKVFKAAQNFSAMVGYITKDQGISFSLIFSVVLVVVTLSTSIQLRSSSLSSANSQYFPSRTVLWPT